MKELLRKMVTDSPKLLNLETSHLLYRGNLERKRNLNFVDLNKLKYIQLKYIMNELLRKIETNFPKLLNLEVPCSQI